VSSPHAESGIAAAPAGVPSGEWATPGVPAGNGQPPPVQVTLPAGAAEVGVVGEGQFLVIRVPSSLTDAQFRQYVADCRDRVPPDLWPRLAILPAEQFAILG
jgi:hypothetical protein